MSPKSKSIRLTAALFAAFLWACLWATPIGASSGVEKNSEKNSATADDTGLSEGPVSVQNVRQGGDIPVRSWRQADRASYAVLLCLHGFGMNMNSYEKFGQQMAELGIPVYAIDLRGFGCWQDAKGYRKLDLDDAVKDVQQALRAIRSAHPSQPLVLVGESMGGSVALQTMAADQSLADGLICSVPAGDRFGEKATDVKVALGMLRGARHIAIGKSVVRQITKDPTLRNELEQDPRGRMNFSPKELMRFSKFMNRTNEEAKKIKTAPVLIMQGGSDRLVKPKGTAQVYINLATKDKDLILIGTSEHLILEEGQFSEQVVDMLSSWVYRHVIVARYPQGRFTEQNTGLAQADFRAANGHFHVGQGLVDLGEESAARSHFLQAIASGRGTPLAMMAAQMLAGLSKPLPLTPGVPSAPGRFVSYNEAMANDKPTVMFFGARWIDPSYQLNDVLQRGASKFGNRVNFVRIDADDPQSQTLVTGYGVKCVPTIVFLNPTNQIMATEIGSLNDQTLAASLPKIVFSNTAAAPISPPAGMPSSRPTVVFFGSLKTPFCSRIENMLHNNMMRFAGKLDLITIDSDDPKNTLLRKQIGDNQLPVVLFLNSSHDVVYYTAGQATEQQIAQGFSSVMFVKHMPMEAEAAAEAAQAAAATSAPQ